VFARAFPLSSGDPGAVWLSVLDLNLLDLNLLDLNCSIRVCSKVLFAGTNLNQSVEVLPVLSNEPSWARVCRKILTDRNSSAETRLIFQQA
jgi:hypothetical protein